MPVELLMERSDWLLVADDQRHRRIRNFALNAASRALVDFLAQGRAVDEILRAFGPPLFDADQTMAALGWLQGLGALEPEGLALDLPPATGASAAWAPEHPISAVAESPIV
ncbi:hypothetical protein [Kribbella sp. VKM Ac-2566]|uniref:hypothetical protein n=1 Tax=Kribbella sp. VKM Ac-2566 TaxID=2512218 RepID=UPI00106280FB|nr:hypothetical protein [Kribbella sp. VKM Ac-2566]